MQLALDVSNYSGIFGSAAVACWRGLGYEHLVCGTQRPEITVGQMAAALSGGMTLDAYVYLYWGRDVISEVRRALETVRDYPVGRLWLDCEDHPGERSPPEVVALIASAAAACGAFPHGIYTGRWWWPAATGNSRAFSHLPLWHAEYTPSASVLPDFERFLPYGGWSRPVMWQYRGTTRLCGVGVDLNVREEPMRPLDDATLAKIELALHRAGQRFDRARALGRYVFRPGPSTSTVELLRIEGGRGVPFEPPYLVAVE